jgi:hypothetical protein
MSNQSFPEFESVGEAPQLLTRYFRDGSGQFHRLLRGELCDRIRYFEVGGRPRLEFELTGRLFAHESGAVQPIDCLRHRHGAAAQGKHEVFDAPRLVEVGFKKYQQLDGPHGANLSMHKGQDFVFVQIAPWLRNRAEPEEAITAAIKANFPAEENAAKARNSSIVSGISRNPPAYVRTAGIVARGAGRYQADDSSANCDMDAVRE